MHPSRLLLVSVAVSVAVAFQSDIRSRLILDVAGAFSSACLRVLRGSSISTSALERYYTLVWSLLRDSNGQSERFITVASVTFKRYLSLVRNNAVGEESCYKSFHIFQATDSTLEEFRFLCQKRKISTTKWLVFMSNYTEETFFNGISIPFDAHILTASRRNKAYVIREVYKITNDTPVTLKTVGWWNNSTDWSLDVRSIYYRRSDLNGIVLRTGSIENWPLSTFVTNSNKRTVLDGFFPRVWRELEERMNFTSINLRSVDNVTGAQDIFGNWNGLVGMIDRKEIDVIVSELNINEERTAVLEFTRPLLATRYQVYFQHAGYSLSWTAVLEPFDNYVWITILAWILVSAMGLSICYKSTKSFTEPSDMSIESSNSVFFMIQCLCQQGYWQVPETASCRIIFLMAYLMSGVLIPSYSASLISSLTAQSPNRPFDTLEGMLNYGRYKLILTKNTAEYTHFSTARNSVYSRVFEKLVLPFQGIISKATNVSMAVNMLCDKKESFALFGPESTYDLKVENTDDPDCHIIKFSKPLSSIYQGMALPKNHPYAGLVNFHIQQMSQTGIIQRLRVSVWPLSTNQHATQFKQVQPSEVFQIFVCLLVGMIFSVFVLFRETFFAKCKKESVQKNKKELIFYQQTWYT